MNLAQINNGPREQRLDEPRARDDRPTWTLISLLAAMSLAAALLAGCEIGGEYHGDNVNVQFGDTNGTVQVLAE